MTKEARAIAKEFSEIRARMRRDRPPKDYIPYASLRPRRMRRQVRLPEAVRERLYQKHLEAGAVKIARLMKARRPDDTHSVVITE